MGLDSLGEEYGALNIGVEVTVVEVLRRVD